MPGTQVSLPSDPVLRARPERRAFLEVADEQIDVGAGVERVAALDDHTVAAVPDEVRGGDADLGGGGDWAAAERDGRTIDSLPAGTRGIDLIRHAARNLEDAGRQHLHPGGAGHGANPKAVGER